MLRSVFVDVSNGSESSLPPKDEPSELRDGLVVADPANDLNVLVCKVTGLQQSRQVSRRDG